MQETRSVFSKYNTINELMEFIVYRQHFKTCAVKLHKPCVVKLHELIWLRILGYTIVIKLGSIQRKIGLWS